MNVLCYCLVVVLFQTWFLGQGLNDNQWHQVSVSRRGGSIRLTIDDEPSIQGKVHTRNNNMIK